jgi:FkbM family methyltransferase
MAKFDFVQIGAHVGKEGDFLAPSVHKKQLKGILVEPVPYLFETLKKNYEDCKNLFFENLAISNEDGVREFHYVDEHANDFSHLPDHASQIGSLSRAHTTTFAAGARVTTLQVRTLTLASLLARYYVTELELLYVDAEGYDFRILMDLNLDQVKPKMIFFENKNLEGAFKKSGQYQVLLRHLLKNGYKILEEDHDNTLVGRKGLVSLKFRLKRALGNRDLL